MNEERIREEVALRLHTRERTVLRIACGNSPLNVSWGDLSEAWKEQFRAGATQILSIKGIRLEADNQDLPEWIDYYLTKEQKELLLKEGWVKCKVKEEQ